MWWQGNENSFFLVYYYCCCFFIRLCGLVYNLHKNTNVSEYTNRAEATQKSKQQVYTRYMEEKIKIEIILQYWNWEGYKVSLFPHRLTWQHNIPRRRRRVLLFVISIDSHTTPTNSSLLLKQRGAVVMGHSDGCHEVWQRGIVYHFCYSFSI